MFGQRTDIDAAAYEYDARYQPQSTEDRENAPQSAQKKPNYRPTPLKWYFIVFIIALLIIAMGLVVWARQSMPDSDHTYKIEQKRWMAYKDGVVAMRTAPVSLPTDLADSDLSKSAAQELRRAAEDFAIFERAVAQPTDAQPTAIQATATQPTAIQPTAIQATATQPTAIQPTAAQPTAIQPTAIQATATQATATQARATEPIYQQQMEGVRATSYIVSYYTEVITVPGSVSRFTTSTPGSIYYSTFTTYSFGSGGSVETKTYTSVMPTMTVIPIYLSATQVVEKVTETFTDTSYSFVPMPGSWNTTRTDMPMSSVPYEVTRTETREITRAGTVGSTVTEVSTDYTETGTETITYADDMQSYGEETTVAYSTNYVPVTGAVTAEPSTYVNIGKVTITSYYTEPVQNPSKNEKGEPKDQDKPKEDTKPTPKVIDVVSVKQDETIKEVKQLGPVTVVKSVQDLEQVVATQAPVTIVRPVQNAVETTVNVVTTGADGVAVTKQVVSTVQAGAYATTVAVIRTGPDGVVRTEQVVSTVVAGAYVTTQNVVITGADGLPTTEQVVSTMRGPLETIVSTPGLTTYTSTKSARLSTITSTPSGSTTITSTRKGTTKTESTTIMEAPEATEDPSQPKVHVSTKVIESTDGSYFLGKFLPAILSVLLSIPLRIIDANAQLYQPFYALNQQHGATGKGSMTLHFSGFKGFLRPFTILSEGQPVPFITMLIVLCSALMTPLATEAIGLKLHGVCKQDNADGCAIALGVSPTSTHALLGLIAFTIVLLCALLFFLRNWETGLHANPWSIVGMASLATNQEIRPRKASEKKIEREMADKKYGFGYFQNTHGETEYGIVLYDDAGQTLHQPDGNTSSETSSIEVVPQKKKRANPFMALGWAWRLTFIAFLLGLIVLVFYYHLMPKKDTDFEKFINGSTFGVRFFFATMGVLLSFGWTALFISVAMIGPYQAMSKDPKLASDSILITRPTNGFTGLWASIKHKQIYPGIVALMTILSEFMPILLTNVPYGLTQTLNTHQIAARASLAIMILMLLTLVGSFFIKWPHMPVDPRSIAGAMYYVTESNMLNQFHGLASVDKKERERRVKEIGGRYWFGQIVAKNGDTRTVVDRDDGMLGIDNYVASRNLHQQHEYDQYEQYQPPQQTVPPQHPQMQQTYQQQPYQQQPYQQQPYQQQTHRRDSQQAYLPVSPQDVDTSYRGYIP